MLSFIKDHSIAALKSKLIALYALNLLDMLFTVVLLSMGGFRELNPIMDRALGSIPSALIVKVALPGAVLLYLYRRLRQAHRDQLRAPNVIIGLLLVGYLLLNLTHLAMLAGALIG